MFVTDIIPLTRNRCRVFIEGEFAFILYKGELRRFKIKDKEEIPEEIYHEVINEVLPRRAKLRCMNLLQTKDYTEKQLENKLREGEYPEKAVREAIEYVRSYGYIDDERYARDYVQYHIHMRSRVRMEQDLIRKGISRDLIQTVFEQLGDEGVVQDEMAMIRDILMKKNYCSETADYKDRQKMYGFLYRKGFHADQISKALLLDIT